MARWLRDAETGELFREDELDAGSYDQITDFQSVAPSEPQYEFPSWLTSGLGTSIPARSLASITKSGASIEEMLGDLASNIPGLEDNALLRDAAENRKRAEDLLNQARRDNQVEPGSWQDIGGAVAGEMIPSLGTLGYGLARGAGKAALAMAPALLPSASRYGDLKEQGVSGPEAALGAAESFGINSLLNRADVGTALNALSSPAKRIGQTALVGGATNAAGAIGDAYIDKQVGAPQAQDEFMSNLLTSTAAGVGTGAGFGAMGALGSMRPRGARPAPDMPVYSADDMLSRMTAEAPPPPQADAPTLGLPDSPNKPVALIPHDTSWIPETYQAGQGFVFRDYAALPPMDISRPQRALSSIPPEPLNWTFNQLDPVAPSRVVPDQPLMLDYEAPRSPLSSIPPEPLNWTYRGIDPGERVFMPEEPLQIGFDGWPKSEMPTWELSPNYKRGDNFQYRDFYSLPPALIDPKSSAIERETAILTTGKAAESMAAAPTKIGDESFPNIPANPKQPEAQASLFGDTAPSPAQIERVPVERYGADLTPPLYTELSPRAQSETMPTFVIPADQMVLDPEIPNFKGDAGPTGEVAGKELKGETYNAATGPIIVMRRINKPQGPYSVITGRHRFAYRKRLGLKNVEVKIIDESPTFGPREAQALDAELNIIDGQGSITDFANYFNKSGMNEQEAFKRGLLSRDEGRTGYNIGMKATSNIWDAWRAGKISDRMASAISNAAPLDDGLQAEGLRLASKGKAQYQIEGALNLIRALDSQDPASGKQVKLFPEETDVGKKTDIAAEIVTVRKEIQDRILDEVRSFEAAAKRPDLAAKRLNFKGKTAEQLLQEAERLKFEAAKYSDEIYLWPDKLEEVKAEVEKRRLRADDARGDTAQRIANKRKRPTTKREIFGVEINSQRGSFSVDWIADLLGNKNLQKDLPDYKDVSDTNKRYAKIWPKMLEWMDTTRKKNPQAAGFIDAYWKIPQDLNAITYDAKLTLEPYLALTAQERASVDNYLAAARVQGARNPSYKITPQTAASMGLDPKQAQAALSVNQWSKEMLNLLEDHAVRVAEHDALKKGATLDSKKAAEIRARFDELRESNYVPFNRYGEHYVNVYDKSGALQYRYQFDKKSDPNLAKTVQQFKQQVSQKGNALEGGRVEYGKADPARLNEHDGVPSDILEILVDNGAQEEVRGFYKHLKPAALVKGFEADMLRNISEYTTGAAKLISLQRAKMAGERELLAFSPAGLRGVDNVNLTKKLTAWADGFNQPTSPAFQAINNAFNVAYIGGNLRTPTADMLGRVQLQYPLMSKYLTGLQPETTFANGINKEMRWWFSSDESFGKMYPDLSNGIKQAQRKGVIPTNIYKTFLRNARGESQGAPAFKNKVHDLYFGLKEISERSTDLGGFILGWEMYPQYMKGKGAGKETRSRQQFAEDFVRESRAVPSQAELPAAFRKETVRLATKYRLYQAKILKSLSQAGWGQWARYLASTGLTTGVVGTIFARDIFSAARFGGVEPEDKLREAGLGSAVMYGPMSALAGVDFSGSAGFGEIFPGSGGNVASKFMLGMAGAPFEAATKAFNYYERGQNNKAIGSLPFMPNPVSNFLTQKDWGERGVVTLGGQAVIPRDEVQGVDRIKKLLGYQPLRVKEAMVRENRKKQAANTGRATGFYNQRIGEAIGLGNVEEAQALIQQAQEEGVTVNTNSVKNYVAKIQGRDGAIPKKARAEVKRVDQLYGNALRD